MKSSYRKTTSAMRPPRRWGGRRVPAAGPSSVAGPASPSWPARLPTREDRARGQILGKMACLRNLQSNIARDGGRMTRSSLHSRLRAAILHGIDTWNVFSIARGEELRPFSTCVRRRRTLFDVVEHDRVTAHTQHLRRDQRGTPHRTPPGHSPPTRRTMPGPVTDRPTHTSRIGRFDTWFRRRQHTLVTVA